ncbi:MAG: hypothetical protein KBG20_11840 [Caldilineaceae bacterium]|nr:hypothetical protein [Caldilineaceae bacterium]MBP8108346.1 hypothetical protein [Caldilineaceae bacterium]MBP8122536.1 hypothetical protein [Caldilineaceae bacterium]MBP9072989.1 hypothetical protein [Caldilineaceae bacterium]
MTQTNYVLAEDPAVDLAVVQAMAEELEDYLVKDELFRQLTVRTPAGDQRPQMSGSDLLVRLHRLHGEQGSLTPAQRAALDQVQTSIDATIHSLRTRFVERLERDMKSRLNSLRWYIDDCRQNRNRCRSEYPFEIRNRQRIEEILKFLGKTLDATLAAQLNQIDERIRYMIVAGEFIWDQRLQPLFPKNVYWYLYVLPK